MDEASKLISESLDYIEIAETGSEYKKEKSKQSLALIAIAKALNAIAIMMGDNKHE